MVKTRITINTDEKFVADLNRIARLKNTNRSSLIKKTCTKYYIDFVPILYRIFYEKYSSFSLGSRHKSPGNY